MTHPIQEYWKIAFANYRIASDSYFAPEMTDPILSPRFLSPSDVDRVSGDLPYFNLIQPWENSVVAYPGFKVRNNFALCRMKVTAETLAFPFSVESLTSAASSQMHRDLLADGFPQDVEFLKRLETFLPTLNAEYLVGTIFNQANVPIASVTIGVTGSVAILISGVVHSDFRGQKISRKIKALVCYMAASRHVQEVFYWTKSDRLTLYADHVDRYLIYVRE